jgi:ribosomal protein L37AE/L43A
MPTKVPRTRAEKYSSRRWKTTEDDNNVVIANNKEPVYMCDKCNAQLNEIVNDKGVYICPLCRQTFVPETQQVKRSLPFSNPDENTATQHNTETLDSTIPSPHEKDMALKKELNLEWGAKSLSQKGTIRFTDYREG